jgi:hypothetical protein
MKKATCSDYLDENNNWIYELRGTPKGRDGNGNLVSQRLRNTDLALGAPTPFQVSNLLQNEVSQSTLWVGFLSLLFQVFNNISELHTYYKTSSHWCKDPIALGHELIVCNPCYQPRYKILTQENTQRKRREVKAALERDGQEGNESDCTIIDSQDNDYPIEESAEPFSTILLIVLRRTIKRR